MTLYNRSYNKFYFLFISVVAVALLTPHVVHGHVFIPKEYAQSAVLAIDIILAYVFYLLYIRDVNRVQEEKKRIENNLIDTYQYLGSVNRKSEILTRFLEFLDVTDSPSEKEVFQHIMQNILVSVARSEKGVLRFVDSNSSKTIKEYQFHKDGDQFVVRLSNKNLLKGEYNNQEGISIMESNVNQNGIRCFLCYKTPENGQDEQLIKTLINQAYLTFLAFNQKKKSLV